MKYAIMIVASIGIIGLWVYGYVCTTNWFDDLDSLFSGLAFIGLIVTIFLQQFELQQNTQALLAQKLEMSNQWQEMKKQNINIKRQRFEASLFNMYNLHFETRNLMEVRGQKGILAFKEYINWVIRYANSHQKSNPHARSTDMYSSCLLLGVPQANSRTNFFTIAEPYLNSLKLIYSSIKQADLQDDAEDRYVEIMQSYLTNYEVMFMVLYYNYLKSKGREASLTKMYNDLHILDFFAFRLKENYELDLKVDSTLI